MLPLSLLTEASTLDGAAVASLDAAVATLDECADVKLESRIGGEEAVVVGRVDDYHRLLDPSGGAGDGTTEAMGVDYEVTVTGAAGGGADVGDIGVLGPAGRKRQRSQVTVEIDDDDDEDGEAEVRRMLMSEASLLPNSFDPKQFGLYGYY